MRIVARVPHVAIELLLSLGSELLVSLALVPHGATTKEAVLSIRQRQKQLLDWLDENPVHSIAESGEGATVGIGICHRILLLNCLIFWGVYP